MLSKTEQLWLELEKDNKFASGVVMKRYSAELIPDGFVALLMPEKIKSIAFRFNRKYEIDARIINNLKDIRIKTIPDKEQKEKQLLILSLSDNELKDIFAVLCEDLFQSIANITIESEFVKTLRDRFEQWKELFERVRNKELSLENQKGLFGELYLLQKMIIATDNPLFCVNLWKGPESGIRDFEYNMWAVEVKTTATHNQQKLFINSERQLDCSNLNNLYLFHLSVEIRTGSIFTLNSIIDNLKTKIGANIQATIIFNMKLLKAGYLKVDKKKYAKISYEIRAERYYQVMDDFPRIEEKDLRINVGNVKYSIIPPENDKYKLSFEEITKSLGAI